MSRSLLFVPGDSARKFDKAFSGEADGLILDLEDSVAPDVKVAARGMVREMLHKGDGAKQLWVRINPLDTAWSRGDLEAILPGNPFGIVLPKPRGGVDVQKLASWLDELEQKSNLRTGSTKILAIATETGEAMFGLGSYKDCSPRLWGLSWGAEDLAADIGTLVNRVDGRYTEPFRLARSLCIFGAAAAGVRAIDTVCVDLDDDTVVVRESQDARRDGFVGKIAIHPKHIPAINAAFTPSAEELDFARRVVAAFEANPNIGAFRLEGKMIDRPHLRAAKRVLGQG
jgi:citrate lyase subunit beta/citryl-CoA lyase